MPKEQAATDRLAVYAAIENEHARDARKTAEALFQPKPTTTTIDHPAQQTAVAPQEVARAPRILNVTAPRRDSSTSLVETPQPSRHVAAVPASEHRRIRTLATYGMTTRQVADIYDASESEIEHILGG